MYPSSASSTTPPMVVVPPSAIPLTTLKRLAPNKPHITINIPAVAAAHHGGSGQTPYQLHSAALSHPSNPATAPPHWPPYANPFNSMYPAGGTAAGAFMFKQFEGFKDFTFASAKSGLNVGEKSAFYIYEKFSKWSKQWFTHIFLFLVIFLYSLAGASIFVAVEGQCVVYAEIFRLIRVLK